MNDVPNAPGTAAPTTAPVEIAGIRFAIEGGAGNVPHQHDIGYFGFVVMMTPRQFRALAAPRAEFSSADFLKAAISEGRPIAPPFLEIGMNEEGLPGVIGHEGRSRMHVIAEVAGDDVEVPVHIFPRHRRALNIHQNFVDALRAVCRRERSWKDVGKVPAALAGPHFGAALLNGKVLPPTPVWPLPDPFIAMSRDADRLGYADALNAAQPLSTWGRVYDSPAWFSEFHFNGNEAFELPFDPEHCAWSPVAVDLPVPSGATGHFRRGVKKYVAMLERGEELPPCTLLWTPDTARGWALQDGNHRAEAHRIVGRDTMKAVLAVPTSVLKAHLAIAALAAQEPEPSTLGRPPAAQQTTAEPTDDIDAPRP